MVNIGNDVGAVRGTPTFSSQDERKDVAVPTLRAHAYEELTGERGDGSSCRHTDSLARLDT